MNEPCLFLGWQNVCIKYIGSLPVCDIGYVRLKEKVITWIRVRVQKRNVLILYSESLEAFASRGLH